MAATPKCFGGDLCGGVQSCSECPRRYANAPQTNPVALVPVDMPSSALSVFERMATTPGITVDALERLMQMHERMSAKQSEELFNAAMSSAQQEMRPIAADATNPQTKSKYASYAALDLPVRPIYTKHGFSLSFNMGECPKDGWLRLLCYVAHTGGHSRTYHIDMPADGKGAKGGDVMTLTHAVGAGASYGMRYLLKMVFNLAVGEYDRDGNEPEPQAPPEPDGYYDAMLDLSCAADEGQQAFADAYRKMPKALSTHAAKFDRPKLEGLKATAQRVDRDRKAAK